MRTVLCCISLLVALSSGQVYSHRTQPLSFPVKGNVYYSVHGGKSRVSLLFRGKVQHTETRGGNSLTIDCSGIVDAPSHNASNLTFRDGFIRHVTVDRIEDGKTRVVLTLKAGDENYDVVGDDGRGVLRIDVFQNPFAVKSQDFARTISPRKHAPASNVAPDSKTQEPPLVNLSAMVRDQLQEAATDKQTQTVAASVKEAEIPFTQTRATKQAMMWLTLACVSLLLTLVSLIVLVRKALRRTKFDRSNSEALKSQLPQSRMLRPEEFVPHREMRDHHIEEVERNALRSAEEWDQLNEPECATVSLAEQYRRSQGDIELALKLREKGTTQKSDTKIGVIKAVKMPKKGTIRIARKSGVGAGELDLAAKLRRLKDVFSEKEEI